jgi:hypothetical protein
MHSSATGILVEEDMRVVGRVIALAALLVPAVTAPVSAQAWKWDFGINGGYSWMTKLLDADQTGLADDAPGQNVKFANGFLVGSQLTFWPSSKIGLRANVRYGSRDIKGSDMPDDVDLVEDVNLWGGTGDLLFRFKSPASEFTKMEMLPYLALGVGAKWHNPGGDGFTCTDTVDNNAFACGPFTAGQTFAIQEGKVITGLVGLGADWRLSRGLALRTEISDQIFKPKLYVATPTGGTNYNVGDETSAKLVHELGAQLGLHFLFGVPRAEIVSVVEPAPAPVYTPAPTPTPAPPPQPVSESVTVCVVDPTAPGGIRMETALFYPARGDTMLVTGGREILLRDAVGNTVVASNADWYIRGQPLSFTVGSSKIQYVTFGTAQMVPNSDLVFIGLVNGLPVYAGRDDVREIETELAQHRGQELSRILTEHKTLRDELSTVKVLYVPLQPTGCVFQPVTLQEQVRKNRE